MIYRIPIEAQRVADNLAWALRCSRAGTPHSVPIMWAEYHTAHITDPVLHARATRLVCAMVTVYAERAAEWKARIDAMSHAPAVARMPVAERETAAEQPREPEPDKPLPFEPRGASELSDADLARVTLRWIYSCGEICCDAVDGYARLRRAVASDCMGVPTDVTRAQIEGWQLSSCDGDPGDVSAPRPPDRAVATPRDQDDSTWWQQNKENRMADTLGGDAHYARAHAEDEGRPMHSPARLALSSVLEWLPEGHWMLSRMTRADDAQSDMVSTRRWAVALAEYWGVDAQAYAAWVGGAQRPCAKKVDGEWT